MSRPPSARIPPRRSVAPDQGCPTPVSNETMDTVLRALDALVLAPDAPARRVVLGVRVIQTLEARLLALLQRVEESEERTRALERQAGVRQPAALGSSRKSSLWSDPP